MSAPRPAHEVAEAIMKPEIPARRVRAGHADVLVDTAKRLERLQAKRRRLRKDLRTVEADIKHEKRNLRALAAQIGRGE